MDIDDGVPEVVVHVGEGLVTQNTGVVDKDVNATKGIDGRLDNSFTVFTRGLVANSLSTKLLDLLNNRVGVDQVVHDNSSAKLGKLQAIGTPKTRKVSKRTFKWQRFLHTHCHHR